MPRDTKAQFIAFALVGVIGFVVDAGTLYLAMAAGAGHYSGRVISYLVAATCTWALNRRYTFNGHHHANWLAEWARFLAANAAGGLVNYSVYALLVATSPIVAAHPVIGVAAGSLSGLAVNFTLSRLVVFTNRS
jgi:putative flippase GtrA